MQDCTVNLYEPKRMGRNGIIKKWGNGGEYVRVRFGNIEYCPCHGTVPLSKWVLALYFYHYVAMDNQKLFNLSVNPESFLSFRPTHWHPQLKCLTLNNRISVVLALAATESIIYL